MLGYKLTDTQGKTHNETQWGENVSHRAEGGKMKFCTKTAIHFYEDPLLATFCNPIHGHFTNPILWEGKAKGRTKTDGLKSICKEFTTLRKVDLPELSMEQRVAIGIRCALQVYTDKKFKAWADRWLSGEDKTDAAAYAAVHAADAAAHAAAHAADAAAHAAAHAAAYAAHAAAHAADAVHAAAYAAHAVAVHAADAAAHAAVRAAVHDAAYAAHAAVKEKKFNLLTIIKEVKWRKHPEAMVG